MTITIVMAWFIAVARAHSTGVTMLVGVLLAAIVIGLGAWAAVAAPPGGTPAALRLVFLLPIGWFLFVSAQRRPNAMRVPVRTRSLVGL